LESGKLRLRTLQDLVVAVIAEHDDSVFPMPRHPVLHIDVSLKNLGFLRAPDWVRLKGGVPWVFSQALDALQDDSL
jgi:hypothetical protein